MKYCVLVVIGSLTLSLNTTFAANLRGSGPNQNSGFDYSIDPDSCEVEITSSRYLRRIVLKNSEGQVIKRWKPRFRKSFSNFRMYAAYLPDGELYVKAGSFKRPKEIGDDFRFELEACLTPVCPFEAEIANELVKGGDFVDEPTSCGVTRKIDLATGEIVDTDVLEGEFRQEFASVSDEREVISASTGESSGLGYTQGALTISQQQTGFCFEVSPLPAAYPQQVCTTQVEDGTLDSDEARACAIAFGCENFDIPD